MRRSLVVATVAIFTGLAVLSRYMKNMVTAIQFINLPLVFTILSGLYFGSRVGFMVGSLSYIISDFLILPGMWTIVDSLLAGSIGALWGFIRKFSLGKVELFILVYLSTFLYDILSSMILYVVFGVNIVSAFIWGVVGLFLPVFGGNLLGVGPVTEASTAFLVCFLSWEINKRGILYEGENRFN